MSDLMLRYLALWNRVCHPRSEPFRSWSNLYVKYAQPYRCYHNMRHIVRCLQKLDEVPSKYFQELDLWLFHQGNSHLRSRDVTEMGLVWHDETYEPGAKDNEMRSAANMRCFLEKGKAFPFFICCIEDGILATRHYSVPSNPLYWFILDIDLSSFGESYEVFMQDSLNIREEYRIAIPSDYDFALGRNDVLKAFYERKSLYLTEYFCGKWESRAKENLERAMEEARKAYRLP